MNKKGGEKLFSMWWFFVLAIVGAGIAVAVLIFYSADVDVRQAEAEILSDNILECLVERGILVDEFLDGDFDVFEFCNLNADNFKEGSNFYFYLNISDSFGKEVGNSIFGGNVAFRKDCNIGKGVEAKYFPKCVFNNGTVLAYEKNDLIKVNFEMIVASNQEGEILVIDKGSFYSEVSK